MDIEKVVDRFFAAIEAGDEAVLNQVYADDVGIWHNFTGAVQNKSENIANLVEANRIATIRYDLLERHVVGDKVIQRHEVTLNAAGRPDTPVHAAIFITVRDGQIVRIDEYLDPAQVNLPAGAGVAAAAVR
jgi:ketosteroid isomerase-like protein